MSPKRLDFSVVQSRLRLMRELLDDLDSVGNIDAQGLTSHRLTRHAVERILAQLVDLAVSVNNHVSAAVLGRVAADYRQSFDLAAEAELISGDLAAELKPSVGLRNVLTHEYADVDLVVVAGSVPRASDAFARYVRSAASWAARRERGSAHSDGGHGGS
jgi:uncharacterized protein YutE (UPF0331/DUF86 family)